MMGNSEALISDEQNALSGPPWVAAIANFSFFRRWTLSSTSSRRSAIYPTACCMWVLGAAILPKTKPSQVGAHLATCDLQEQLSNFIFRRSTKWTSRRCSHLTAVIQSLLHLTPPPALLNQLVSKLPSLLENLFHFEKDEGVRWNSQTSKPT